MYFLLCYHSMMQYDSMTTTQKYISTTSEVTETVLNAKLVDQVLRFLRTDSEYGEKTERASRLQGVGLDVALSRVLASSEAKIWKLLYNIFWTVLLDECPKYFYFLLIWLKRLLWLQKMAASMGKNSTKCHSEPNFCVLTDVLLRITYQYS